MMALSPLLVDGDTGSWTYLAAMELEGKGDRRAFSGNRWGDMQLRRPPKMPVNLSIVLELAMVVLRRQCFSIDVLLLMNVRRLVATFSRSLLLFIGYRHKTFTR
jgi:hypothetical protein